MGFTQNGIHHQIRKSTRQTNKLLHEQKENETLDDATDRKGSKRKPNTKIFGDQSIDNCRASFIIEWIEEITTKMSLAQEEALAHLLQLLEGKAQQWFITNVPRNINSWTT